MKINVLNGVLWMAIGFVFIACFPISAQVTGSLSLNGRPLKGALVHVQSEIGPVYSDKNGFFSLSSSPGLIRLKVVSMSSLEWDTTFNYDGKKVFLLKDLEPSSHEISQVEILGNKAEAMRHLPGAAALIPATLIQSLQPVQANEVLRKVPGVHAVDEEGMGLRANIGFRGLDPDRSRYVLVLEDGVPVSLSPYGEPEMYYAPSIDRMEQVEVLKGSSSIAYGPRTIAGVVNYRTVDPSIQPSGLLQMNAGPGGYVSALARYSTTAGSTGIVVSYLRKQTDDFGTLRLRLNDVNTKFRWMISSREALTLKIGLYDEESNSTYIGLTRSMYEEGRYDFTRLAPDDQFVIRRYSASLSYLFDINDRLRLEVLGFAYTTQRNWNRQDFTYSALDSNGMLLPRPADYSGVTWGDTTVSGGAIFMRNSTGNRNRRFDVVGLEPRLRYVFSTGSLKHEVLAGLRMMAEKAYEIRINGKLPGALSGEISEDEVRPVQGYSAFVSARFSAGRGLEFHPGIRMEYMQFEREIYRGRYRIGSATQVRDTLINNESSLSQLVPGLGFNYVIRKEFQLFGGVHRGFAPPRLKDAITSDGVDQQLSAELSWNYEIGSRTKLFNGMEVSLTAFLLDFENQVIPVSESSGGTGTGLINGGETSSRGLEASINGQFHPLRNKHWTVRYLVNFTYTEARFSSDRFSGSAEERINISGNRLPYAPEWTGNALLILVMPKGFELQYNLQYTGTQFTDARNTIQAPANGLTGKLPAYTVMDAGLAWHWQKAGTRFNFMVRNFTDERYIYTRRPQGIRVGLERMLFFGVRKEF
jgi:Fe(3+) dicitrate transport protein